MANSALPPLGSAARTTTGDAEVARSRFLANEPVPPDAVRAPILASWHRSYSSNVAPDELETPYDADLDREDRLRRSSESALETLQEQLCDQPVSVILTDTDGIVLDRRTGTPRLKDRLDRVCLAPGFSYAERHVGTNGIGTALEGSQPTYVYEQEHYTEHLTGLACAGVPVRDPFTGRLAGLLDLTCWASDASPLLMTLARDAGRRIEATLREQGSQQDVALLHEYLVTTRRYSDPILAYNANVVMTNDAAREWLTQEDQSALIESGLDHARPGGRAPAAMTLPSGMRCRVQFKQVTGTRGARGAVLRVRLAQPKEHALAPATLVSTLPGLIGAGSLWTQSCQRADEHFRSGHWICLEGEAGVGKAALAIALHRQHRPTERMRVLDGLAETQADSWLQEAREALEDASTVVVTHADQLDDPTRTELAALLRSATENRPELCAAVTKGNQDPPEELASELLVHFPHTVEVPPLRHHIDDVPELVRQFSRQACKNGQLVWSQAAMQVLMRTTWPGNVAQLRSTVYAVAKRNRGGTVRPTELPTECRSQTRRVLTPIESVERDAIYRSLTDANGNKTAAARNLGLSRATIYRKLKEYGITVTGERGAEGSTS